MPKGRWNINLVFYRNIAEFIRLIANFHCFGFARPLLVSVATGYDSQTLNFTIFSVFSRGDVRSPDQYQQHHFRRIGDEPGIVQYLDRQGALHQADKARLRTVGGKYSHINGSVFNEIQYLENLLNCVKVGWNVQV